MTYNFDPDRWYDNHRALLEERRNAGEFDERAFREAMDRLNAEHDEMVARLDGTYELPD
jgi:hypothetical protein